MSFNNIYEWPLLTRLLLLGLVFSASIYMGYRFDLSYQIKNLSRAYQQEADLRQQIELVVRKNMTVKGEVARLPKDKTELIKWKNQLVSYKTIPELLNQILKLGAENNVFLSRFAPGEPVKVAIPSRALDAPAENDLPSQNNTAVTTSQESDKAMYYNKIQINVVVVGNYHQISNFISQVANMSWIVSIGNFTISNDNQPTLLGDKVAKQASAQGLLSAELTMDVYYLD